MYRMYSRSMGLWRAARQANPAAARCRCCAAASAAEPTSKRQQKKQQQQQQQNSSNGKAASEAAITRKSEDYSRCCAATDLTATVQSELSPAEHSWLQVVPGCSEAGRAG